MSNSAPNFDIVLGSKLLSGIEHDSVSDISLTESITDTAKLKIAIKDHEGYALTSDRLKFRTEIELYLGYGNSLDHMFQGELVQVTPTFLQADSSLLELVFLDRSYLLKKKPLPFVYEASRFDSFASVAQHIANRHKLELVIGIEDKLSKYILTDDQAITQDKDTDWEMLHQIKRTNNYKLFVQGSTIYMVDDSYLANRQSYKFVFEHRPIQTDVDSGVVIPLYEFKPSLGAKGQREKVQVISWKNLGTEITEEEEATNKDTEGNEGYAHVKIQSSTIETIRVPVLVKDKTQARAAVEAEMQRRSEDIIQGSGLVQGLPRLRIGNSHIFKLNDLGESGVKYSGEYHITETTHKYDTSTGYTTGFKARKTGLTK